MTHSDPSILTYAKPAQGRRSGVLTVIALGIALVSLVLPGLMVCMLYRNRGKATSTTIGLNPAYYALPLASILLAVLGARKRSKLLPSVAILMAIVAAGSMWFICSRTW